MNEVEHRGWEVNNEHDENVRDNAYHDIAEDEIETSTGPVLILVGVILLGIGVYLLGKYLSPPAVIFPPPIVRAATYTPESLFPPGYNISCIKLDGITMTIEPNYKEPHCQQKFKEVAGK